MSRTNTDKRSKQPKTSQTSEHTEDGDAKSQLKNVNPHLKELSVDVLYHLGFDSSMNLKEWFGDVKFVCMGGSADRMRMMMRRVIAEVDLKTDIPFGCDIATVGKAERYHMYKVGPVICVNHGMGMPSLSILLHELTKLLWYAGAKDFVYIRVGTCGGLGVKPGTVMITKQAVNSQFQPVYRMEVLGKVVERPAIFDAKLIEELTKYADHDIRVVVGDTLCTDGFYEQQARLDGFLCDITSQEQREYLSRAHESGVRNIEMESMLLAAFCRHTGIPAAALCVAILNRLEGDQVTSSKEELEAFTEYATTVVLRYIKAKLHKSH